MHPSVFPYSKRFACAWAPNDIIVARIVSLGALLSEILSDCIDLISSLIDAMPLLICVHVWACTGVLNKPAAASETKMNLLIGNI